MYILILLFTCFIIYSLFVSTKKQVYEDFGWIGDIVNTIIGPIVGPIENLIHTIENDVNTAKNFITNVIALFGEVGNLFSVGFDLLKQSVTLLITVSEILYLIVTKMTKCYEGYKEVHAESVQEITNIQNRLKQMKNNLKSCVLVHPHLKGINPSNYKLKLHNYMTNCSLNYNNKIQELHLYTQKFKTILNNAKLFALQNPTSEGQSKTWCSNNYKKGASFSYAKNCNQCFNFDGLISKELSELVTVEKLIQDSMKMMRIVGQISNTIQQL